MSTPAEQKKHMPLCCLKPEHMGLDIKGSQHVTTMKFEDLVNQKAPQNNVINGIEEARKYEFKVDPFIDEKDSNK